MVGVAICSEVMFDDLVQQSVRAGAQLLSVPTNNATFGFTEMTYQQQAIPRVRAVAHGRPVLVAATSGVRAGLAPDGAVRAPTTAFTRPRRAARGPPAPGCARRSARWGGGLRQLRRSPTPAGGAWSARSARTPNSAAKSLAAASTR